VRLLDALEYLVRVIDAAKAKTGSSRAATATPNTAVPAIISSDIVTVEIRRKSTSPN